MTKVPSINELIKKARRIEQHHPWPRANVEAEVWTFAVAGLVDGHWTLLGLWSETDCVHMALLAEPTEEIGVISLNCSDGRYPSVGQHHPPAIRLERAVQDLF